MTTRHKTNFGCLQATYAHDFLLSMTIDELDQYILSFGEDKLAGFNLSAAYNHLFLQLFSHCWR
jgi:hypothetical protein